MQHDQGLRFQAMAVMSAQKARLMAHHGKMSKVFQKIPFVGKSLAATPPNIRQEGAMKALGIITLLGIFNFADQSVPSAVKTLFADDLNISDAESSYPVAAMGFSALVWAVVLGWVNDKEWVGRRTIMFFCAFIWSICTTLAGLSTTLGELVFWRSCVGIGTGAFNVIAPVMIADYFPIVERNFAYGILALSIPVGAALGFGAGAVIGSAYDWRVAFYALGVPSVALSFAVFLLNDPVRGVNDATVTFDYPVKNDTMESNGHTDSDIEVQVKPVTPSVSDETKTGAPTGASSLENEWLNVKEILTCPPFMYAVAGLTGANFALSALADWLPTFLVRYCDANLDDAGIIVGLALVVGGISGNILGAQSAAYFEPRVKSSYFLIPAIYTIPAAFLFLLVNNETSDLNLVYVYIFLSMIFCWTFVAPLAAVTVNVIRPSLRSLAGGLAHLIVSILGNIISPPIVGAVSDDTGSLRTAMQSVWITTLVSGVCWFCGYYFLVPLGDMGGSADSPSDALSFTDFLLHGGIAAPGRGGVAELTQDVKNPMTAVIHDGDEDSESFDSQRQSQADTIDNSKYMSSVAAASHSARRASYLQAERNSEAMFSPLHGMDSTGPATRDIDSVGTSGEKVLISSRRDPPRNRTGERYASLTQEL